MQLNNTISQDELRRLLSYNPDTGLFTWLVRTAKSINAGDIAGGLSANGYMKIRIYYKHYPSHQLAWLYMAGEIPYCQIDHINRIRHDNRWVNLRLATRGNLDNQQNMEKRFDNTSGFAGVSYQRKSQKIMWRARIMVGHKSIHIGYFTTPELAHAAYIEAKKRLHEFWPGT